MSPRPLDPRIRSSLIDVGARLLADEGPQALSTRRIAAEAGTSTMAVYTYFGGMNELVREMVYEGFARLHHYLTGVVQTDDPVADMAMLGRAYRHNAQANSHLYSAMFGGSSLAGFSLTEQDRQHGRYNLVSVIDCASRCVAAQRFQPGDPALVAHQMWFAMHGMVSLELGGYLIAPWTADRCFEAQLVGLMVSVGDNLESATRSVELSSERFLAEVLVSRDSSALPEEYNSMRGANMAYGFLPI